MRWEAAGRVAARREAAGWVAARWELEVAGPAAACGSVVDSA